MGISDEIEDATIAFDETKISEIEATKRRSDEATIYIIRILLRSDKVLVSET